MDGDAHTGWRSEPHLNLKISLMMDVELILIFLEHHHSSPPLFSCRDAQKYLVNRAGAGASIFFLSCGEKYDDGILAAEQHFLSLM